MQKEIEKPKKRDLSKSFRGNYHINQEWNRACGAWEKYLTTFIKSRLLSEEERIEVIQPYWFWALFIPFMGIDWLRKKIASALKTAQERKMNEEIK